MNVERLAIAAVTIILVVANAVLMLMPAPDDRTETEGWSLRPTGWE